jgi:uncharacterized protein (TIRG00374 family)
MRVLLPLLLLAFLCWWFGLEPVVRALAHASPRGLAIYLLLTAAVLLMYAMRWRLIVRALGGQLPVGRLLAARLAGDAVGALVPSARLAGEPLRVALARDGGISTAQSGAGVALDRFLEIGGNTLAALAYVAIFFIVRGASGMGSAPLAMAGVMTILLLGLVVLVVRLRRGHRPLAPLYGERVRRHAPRFTAWMDGLRQIEDHVVRFFRQHPRTFAIGLLASLAVEALTLLQYHALLSAFGIALDLPTLCLVVLGSGIASGAPVPAGIGALEAAQVALVGAGAGRPELGFVVGIVVRLHETLLLALGLAALSYRGVSLARLRIQASQAEA